ncbi:MAG: DUF1559 domain-containing protein [Planctomycetia bacterium]|nr:DUF1559 domain-containing protein [Planctomycetia bacterium]
MRSAIHISLGLAGWCALAATSLAAETAAPIDVTYVQPGFSAAVIVHPRRILESPLLKMLPAEDLDRVLKRDLPPDVRVSPRLIDEVQLLIGPPAPGTERELPISVGLVIRMAAGADPHQLVPEAIGKGEPAEFGGKKYTRIPKNPPAGYFFADDRTLVFGDEKSLQQMISASGKPSPLVDMLARMDGNHDVVAAGLMAPFQQMLSPAAKDAGQHLPPPLQRAAALPDQVKWAALTVDLSGENLLKLSLEGNDAAASKDLAGHFTAGRDFLKQMYDAKRPLIERDTPPDARQPILKLLDDLMAGLTVTQNAERVTLTLKSPADLAELPTKLKPMIEDARQRAAAAVRMNKLRMVAMAMYGYQTSHDETFPPAAIVDKKTGKPLLSWRVLMLPYLEERELAQKFHLDEPWDSPNNLPLAARMPAIFAGDPNSPNTKNGKTSMLVFTGPGMFFDGAEGKSLGVLAIAGVSNRILLVEAGDDKAVPWTKPEDLTLDAANPAASLGTLPDGKIRAVFFDMHVEVLDAKMDPARLRSMILIDDKAPAAGATPAPAGAAGGGATAPGAEQPWRTWTDASGSHQVEAQLIAVEGDSVRVKKKDGKVVLVPLARLSAADQEYAKKAMPAKP